MPDDFPERETGGQTDQERSMSRDILRPHAIASLRCGCGLAGLLRGADQRERVAEYAAIS